MFYLKYKNNQNYLCILVFFCLQKFYKRNTSTLCCTSTTPQTTQLHHQRHRGRKGEKKKSFSINAAVLKSKGHKSLFNMSGLVCLTWSSPSRKMTGNNCSLYNCQTGGRSSEEHERLISIVLLMFSVKRKKERAPSSHIKKTTQNIWVHQSCGWQRGGGEEVEVGEGWEGGGVRKVEGEEEWLLRALLWFGFGLLLPRCVFHSLFSLPVATRCSRVSGPCGWSSSCGGTSGLRLAGGRGDKKLDCPSLKIYEEC